jgi:hypothetical protein
MATYDSQRYRDQWNRSDKEIWELIAMADHDSHLCEAQNAG